MKYWRMRNTSNALAKNAGTSSGSHVPTHPSSTNSVYVGMIVTAYGRKIVAISSVNSAFLPGKAEARESVRHEGAGEHGPDRPDDRQRERVEQQARIVDQVPDFGKVRQLRGERPRRLERAPRSLPHDRRRRRIARVHELALCPPRLQQRQLAGRAVERHVVDIERLAFVFKGRRVSWVDRRSRLTDLLRGLEGERRRAQQRRQERGEEQDGNEREKE